MTTTDKALCEANAARSFYVDKIKKMHTSLTQQDFEKLSELELQQKLKKIRELLDKFENKCIAFNCVDASGKFSQENDEIEALCEALTSKIEKKLVQCEQAKSIKPQELLPSANAAETEAKKHEIQNTWGEFNGSLVQWHQYKKHFIKDVFDNENIDQDSKLKLLQDSCKGRASEIVSNADNYQNAWNRLNEIFGETYMQIHYVLYRIQSFQRITEPCSAELQKLLRVCRNAMEILSETMDRNQFETLITVMLTDKLDQETMLAWDRHREMLALSWSETTKAPKHKFTPSQNNFADFIKSEIDLHTKNEVRQQLQSAKFNTQKEQPQSAPRNAPGSSNNAQNNLHKIAIVQSQQSDQADKANAPYWKQCPLCPVIHPRYDCVHFNNMGWHAKWQHIEEWRLCQKCLRSNHGNAPCENKLSNEPCKRCYHQRVTAYHNSTMCPVKHGLPANSNQTSSDAQTEEYWT